MSEKKQETQKVPNWEKNGKPQNTSWDQNLTQPPPKMQFL